MLETVWSSVKDNYVVLIMIGLLPVFIRLMEKYTAWCRRQQPLVEGDWKPLVLAPLIGWWLLFCLVSIAVVVIYNPPGGSITAMWIMLGLLGAVAAPLFFVFKKRIRWNDKEVRLWSSPFREKSFNWQALHYVSYNGVDTVFLRFGKNGNISFNTLHHGYDVLLAEAQKHLAANRQKDDKS